MRTITVVKAISVRSVAIIGALVLMTGYVNTASPTVRRGPQIYREPSARELVEQEAAATGVPLKFAIALIATESDWNPNAIGFSAKHPGNLRRADHGLMQINFQTALRYGFSNPKQLLQDIALNVHLGFKNICECRDLNTRGYKRLTRPRVKPSVNAFQLWFRTAACYNAGPENFELGYGHAEKVFANMFTEKTIL